MKGSKTLTQIVFVKTPGYKQEEQTFCDFKNLHRMCKNVKSVSTETDIVTVAIKFLHLPRSENISILLIFFPNELLTVF